MSAFTKLVKEAKDLMKCPKCKTPLHNWGDQLNYPTGVKSIFWQCPNCDYERTTYESMKDEV